MATRERCCGYFFCAQGCDFWRQRPKPTFVVDFRRGRRTAADLRKVRSQKMCVREMREICVEIALPMPPQGGEGVSILGICFAESISVVESSFVVSFACGGVRGNGWGCCGIVLVR